MYGTGRVLVKCETEVWELEDFKEISDQPKKCTGRKYVGVKAEDTKVRLEERERDGVSVEEV